MGANPVTSVLSAAAERYGLALAPVDRTRLEQYIALVFRWQRIANLTAAAGPAQFAREHVVDCLAVVPHLGPGRVLDVGSGAGLPGLVIAICQPERPVTVLESRAKRARFLTQVKIELALDQVEVVCGRAERYHPAEAYDVIIARAFGSLAEFASATRGAQGATTRLIAMKAAVDAAELARAGGAEVIALDVPGYRERKLLVTTCGAAATGEGARLVP